MAFGSIATFFLAIMEILGQPFIVASLIGNIYTNTFTTFIVPNFNIFNP